MLGLFVELTLVGALFVWLYRRQLRDRDRASRIPHSQLPLDFDGDGGS